MTDRSHPIAGRYAGQRNTLFGLALRVSILTVLTLGIYRFWGKTRIRKYIWSSVSADGDNFEYTGTGLEKFLGFLVAIVILAIYLGVVQMVLLYFGFNLFIAEPQTQAELIAQIGATYITIFAALPLIFFAQYRARRYKLARTRWRGIRFGAEKGAWGYVWRALLHWLLTISTFGVTLPRQTYYLEKYVTDRSWYGDARFTQEGKWTRLYPAMKHVAIGVAILVTGALVAGLVLQSPFMAVITTLVGYAWLIIGFVYYRVQAFRYLTRTKALGDGIRFAADPSSAKIVMIFIFGGLVVGLIVGIAFAILAAISGGLLAGAAADGSGLSLATPALVVIGLLYIFLIGVSGALSLAWITQPIIEHIVESVRVVDGEALSSVRQRAADMGADAEGFADAMDVGGAI